jgi:hypothetical protein
MPFAVSYSLRGLIAIPVEGGFKGAGVRRDFCISRGCMPLTVRLFSPPQLILFFSFFLYMTAGAALHPSPYREQRDFSLRFEMTEGKTK